MDQQQEWDAEVKVRDLDEVVGLQAELWKQAELVGKLRGDLRQARRRREELSDRLKVAMGQAPPGPPKEDLVERLLKERREAAPPPGVPVPPPLRGPLYQGDPGAAELAPAPAEGHPPGEEARVPAGGAGSPPKALAPGEAVLGVVTEIGGKAFELREPGPAGRALLEGESLWHHGRLDAILPPGRARPLARLGLATLGDLDARLAKGEPIEGEGLEGRDVCSVLHDLAGWWLGHMGGCEPPPWLGAAVRERRAAPVGALGLPEHLLTNVRANGVRDAGGLSDLLAASPFPLPREREAMRDALAGPPPSGAPPKKPRRKKGGPPPPADPPAPAAGRRLAACDQVGPGETAPPGVVERAVTAGDGSTMPPAEPALEAPEPARGVSLAGLLSREAAQALAAGGVLTVGGLLARTAGRPAARPADRVYEAARALGLPIMHARGAADAVCALLEGQPPPEPPWRIARVEACLRKSLARPLLQLGVETLGQLADGASEVIPRLESKTAKQALAALADWWRKHTLEGERGAPPPWEEMAGE